MDFLNSYNNYWSIIETLIALSTLSVTFFLFFNDPIRRWKFLGFRPTVMVVLFDPKIKKVLLVKSFEWGFNQGSIYGNNITQTIEDTLERELGIGNSLYRIYFVNPLGKVRIKNRRRIKRIALGSISFLPNLLGKGYIGCFLDTDLNKLRKKIKLGYGLENFSILSVEAARKKIASIPSIDNPFKQKVHKKLFQTLINLIDNWQVRSRSL